jgi:hypothetical protein
MPFTAANHKPGHDVMIQPTSVARDALSFQAGSLRSLWQLQHDALRVCKHAAIASLTHDASNNCCTECTESSRERSKSHLSSSSQLKVQ